MKTTTNQITIRQMKSTVRAAQEEAFTNGAARFVFRRGQGLVISSRPPRSRHAFVSIAASGMITWPGEGK